MATVPTEEEKRKKPIGYSFPQNPPPGGSIYRSREPSTPSSGLGVVNQSGPSLSAPWYSREYATAANMSDKGGLELERGRAAGAVGLPENDPVRRLAEVGTLSTGMAQAAPEAPKPTATAPPPAIKNQRMEGGPIATPGAPGTTQNPIIAKPNQSVQQAAKQADMQAGQTETTAMQQPLGKDIGFGIRKLDMPGQTPVYMGEGPNPSLPSSSGIAYAPVARQINMPVLNRGMGVFSSMADFANQAGKAYGAIAQNKSDNKSARIGMDVVKMNSDISQDALKLGLDQQREYSDMGLNAIKQAQANLQNNSMSAIESARQEYLAAGDDPVKQKAAARKLQVLGGKDKDNEWALQVTPPTKNLDGTTTPGSVFKYNRATGEVVPVQVGEASGQQKAVTGQKFSVGQTVVKPDGSRGRVVAIDANGTPTEIQPL